MNTTLRHTHTAALDINKTLKSITFYTWIAAGVLFVGYLYFVGAITFSVIKERELQQHTRALVSSMGAQELEFLSTQKILTEQYAREKGFVEPASVSFAPSQRAFAWNVGR
jgi:hypothetical protein